jgi:hypothetical protein
MWILWTWDTDVFCNTPSASNHAIIHPISMLGCEVPTMWEGSYIDVRGNPSILEELSKDKFVSITSICLRFYWLPTWSAETHALAAAFSLAAASLGRPRSETPLPGSPCGRRRRSARRRAGRPPHAGAVRTPAELGLAALWAAAESEAWWAPPWCAPAGQGCAQKRRSGRAKSERLPLRSGTGTGRLEPVSGGTSRPLPLGGRLWVPLRGPEGGPGAKADAGGSRSWLGRAGDRTLASLRCVTGPAVLTAARRRSGVGVGNAGARREERRSGRGGAARRGGGSGVGDCGAPGGGAESARRASLRAGAGGAECGGWGRGVRGRSGSWQVTTGAGVWREVGVETGGLQFTDVITTRAWSCWRGCGNYSNDKLVGCVSRRCEGNRQALAEARIGSRKLEGDWDQGHRQERMCGLNAAASKPLFNEKFHMNWF